MPNTHRPHTFLAKYQIGRMALQDPDRFFQTFGTGSDGQYLLDLWTGLGLSLPPDLAELRADGRANWGLGTLPDISLFLTQPRLTLPHGPGEGGKGQPPSR